MVLGFLSWSFKLWNSANGDGVSGRGMMVKEELCEKVVKIRRVSDCGYIGF